MTANRFTLDTNVLIYALDVQAKGHHEKAMAVVKKAAMADSVLTLQALSEFYYAATRKNILHSEIARKQVEDWLLLFPIVTAKPSTLTHAIRLVERHKLSFWDALLWATAHDAGVTRLISEDFQHNQMFKGMKIINPFIEEIAW